MKILRFAGASALALILSACGSSSNKTAWLDGQYRQVGQIETSIKSDCADGKLDARECRDAWALDADLRDMLDTMR